MINSGIAINDVQNGADLYKMCRVMTFHEDLSRVPIRDCTVYQCPLKHASSFYC